MLLSRLLGRLWFRTLQREGDLPAGPALLVLNHPNGLLDALVPSALLDPPPRFVAKATLWRIPVLWPFLALFAPIAVHRRQDQEVTPEATARTFAGVHRALANGEVVALFPEGISHAGADLARLKTGAARLCLTSPVPVRLVPAGLVYGRRQRFRHSVLLRLGPPIPWEDLAGAGADPDAVRRLTERIREALLPLTLHGPQADVRQLAEKLAWLLAEGPGGRVDLEKVRLRVRALLSRLEELDAWRRASLATRVEAARRELRALGVRPDQIGHAYTAEEIARWAPRAAGHLVAVALLFPAVAAFWPAYRACGWVADRLTSEADQVATFRLVAGATLLPIWTAALTVAAVSLAGITGLAAIAAAAAAAFAALPLLDRLREDAQAIAGFRAARHPVAVARLMRERAALLSAFPELADPAPTRETRSSSSPFRSS
jgi:1-acyl-sn-glycerol-3-phosphate acyltransferase